jgi:predicted enzyme related to lactoylglutathione lyase
MAAQPPTARDEGGEKLLGSAPVVANIPVVDLQRARTFYTQTLGLKEHPAAEPDAVYMDAGEGTRLFLYRRGEPTKAEHTAISFKVGDVPSTVQNLKSKGVKFESYDMGEIKTDADNIAHVGELAAAWFKDPEGNILCVANM